MADTAAAAVAAAVIISVPAARRASSKMPEYSAAWMTQSMSGRPCRILMFLRGTETEPPRAGMTATIRGTTSPSKTGEAGAAAIAAASKELRRQRLCG